MVFQVFRYKAIASSKVVQVKHQRLSADGYHILSGIICTLFPKNLLKVWICIVYRKKFVDVLAEHQLCGIPLMH